MLLLLLLMLLHLLSGCFLTLYPSGLSAAVAVSTLGGTLAAILSTVLVAVIAISLPALSAAGGTCNIFDNN